MIKLTILDVGHGTSIVASSKEEVIVIDAGRGATLAQYLTHEGKRSVSHVLISHADADHLDGLNGLLLNDEFEIGTVYINADAPRTSRSWSEFRTAIRIREHRGDLPRFEKIATDTTIPVTTPDLTIRVLAPMVHEYVTGVGGRHLDGGTVDANALSAVVAIEFRGRRILVAGGDAGQRTFQALADAHADIRAEIVAFPHHGGRPGRADMRDFGALVAQLTDPCWVVFCNGRGLHGTPQPAIVSGIRSVSPRSRIACTQLSTRCAAVLPPNVIRLSDAPAKGHDQRRCCAGTLQWIFNEDDIELNPSIEAHDRFIDVAAETPLCRG